MALKFLRDWQPFMPRSMGNAGLPPAEQVRLECRTMTVGDVFKAQEQTGVDLLAGLQIDERDRAEQRQSWQMICHIIGTYTRSWVNVELDGKPLTIGEEVAASAGIEAMPMLGEVVGYIISASQGTDAEAKNSVGQSEPKSSASGSTAEPAS